MMSNRNLFGNLKIPDVDTCCGCVTDIKTAATIIAVLGIVTCPLVSWAVIRHAYVIRVSCIVTTSSSRADVVDINLNNILSFGFGANAGLGPSCIVRNKTETAAPTSLLRMGSADGEAHSQFVSVVRFLGWLVLVADALFLLSSINLLVKMFRGLGQQAGKYFIMFGLPAVILSFIYGLLYVSACVFMGGSFPVFEFVFSLVDLLMWSYFLIVVYSYRRKPT
ncbi:uncharacterized protein LOC125049612 isoform X2 [Pieris napi]|uniref:uncharacterized protein LOC125049612 isoform X2 n=1 Tax=Pieris napi TaxID=78633 RepID=UPI001FBBC64A|nr:uncharacterized protein LOC125049612 isoform X2 [Pieris napi]